ncbi:16S rRNA (cytosine(967)-C(5))-methyltransferase RsmB [Pelobacter propionicus]|uniref:16S rRNA (cytosine(967)-C(5))-methyltransferase n=1 Tax=Pelobacter propionicus (strain DSM 2379 / NBRC 103807 / OttBd1) TaxID=338966 RepID=A1AU15_PELPD|nr:16S rRNA (cytosine(967)-C(5))-methyltransferase RsmB [Pelobacter propionicus]ABL00836.1 sun protein [Pelobacter propionicus DSM 2379]
MSAPDLKRSNPRQSACSVLLRIQREGCYADQLMDRELESGGLTGPDRGLFAELVFGALRRQGTLDHILSSLLTQPLSRLEPQALILLRVGLYQLVYLDRIPESAAVNESVNLAKKTLPRASGLVNAVLRNYLRRGDDIPFPDPLAMPAESIAARHSHPLWLVRQWIDQLGVEEAEALAEASSRQAPLALRANTLAISRDDLLVKFSTNGIQATPCRFSPHGILVEGRHQITSLPGFHEGLFAVQDEASQMAGLLLDPRPGERILDACAAPGGKATHLAQLMNDRGELLAMDVSGVKLPLIQESAHRLGISIIRTRRADLLNSAAFPVDSFDRVLLDAPCSGLGVIRRNPEAKWRLRPEDLTRLAETQRRMFANAVRMLKPGGRLVYSTCSTSREENEAVLHAFLSRQDGVILEDLNQVYPCWSELFTREGMLRSWPHCHGMDGFFAARLIKR